MTIFFAILFSVSTLVFAAGLAMKIAQYARTPAPLKIPTTPAPLTKGGVALRLGREALLFESLFRGNKPLWLFAFVFHLGLAVVLIRHARYFETQVGPLVALVQPLAQPAGLAMVAGLALLLVRRLVVERVRYVTGPSDILMLVLLLGIGVSGMLMKCVVHTDIVAVKAFFTGLMGFELRPLPADPLLGLHLLLVCLLMIIFPFSKLLHAPGLFFSPTRNQTDNPREVRHLAPWAARLEEKG
ncbi:respiratory nitrate reductase subunit gamma [Paramagnetospirillum magneticum]|uniref:Nitrate reductase gamma subunit n=1 Tax=Paramagnetospirillum magneticum (strain ATCC 700264 / AMB-1) TaxID=342108 RepID=Q2W1U8_PARM1|nr:respiratory nitrate reductase subunit gamma [Paramagnetospirillum magneticum]BAE52177.1 Nitrate reductase gamma subunit [Paramagnetospirillum magneticum AMB-1]